MSWWKIPVVIVSAVLVTALGIDAADTMQGSRSTLLASLISVPSECEAGTVLVVTEMGRACIDQYEAGVGSECAVASPASAIDTSENVATSLCRPVSTAGVLPWRFVTYRQAEQLCAQAGKSLVTPEWWYQAALGTIDNGDCNTNGALTNTGELARCVSGSGAYDMVGNVWEYVQGSVVNGSIDGTVLPPSGYVTEVGTAGIPIHTSPDPSPLYQSDYLWMKPEGTYSIMRGGFYGSKADAGLYSMHAEVVADFASAAIGFRCMKLI